MLYYIFIYVSAWVCILTCAFCVAGYVETMSLNIINVMICFENSILFPYKDQRMQIFYFLIFHLFALVLRLAYRDLYRFTGFLVCLTWITMVGSAGKILSPV